MGRIFFSIDKLGFPLRLADERIVHMPRGSKLYAPNQEVKLIFFLKADHKMQVQGRPPLSIQDGDALIMPFRMLQVYTLNRGNTDKKLHIFRMVFEREVIVPPPSGSLRSGAVPAGEENPARFLEACFDEIHLLPKCLTPRIYEQLNRLRFEAERKQPGYRLLASGICFDIFVHVARLFLQQREQEGKGEPFSKSQVLTQRVKDYLLDHLSEELTLEKIAWEVGLSREHLARMFHKTTGKTVFDYLMFLRLEEAKVQLCDTGMLVRTIAEKTGFTSASLFNRTFRRHTGMTPLEFRRRQVGESKFQRTMTVHP